MYHPLQKKIGVGDQTVRGIVVQKRNKPGYDVILKIVQAFAWLNIDWLITGKGEMVITKKEESVELSPTIEIMLDYLREKDQQIQRLIEEKSLLEVRYDDLKKNNRLSIR